MSTPEILYRNLLDISNSGRGDGTIYAHGTGASISGKVFDLTAGYTEMADLTPGDDLHNGTTLVFTTSGRPYLITDWVTATELATVFETPNAEDTGAWTIRRTLYTDDFNVATPVRYGVNGRLYQKWVDGGANNTASIFAAAPNGILNGGFELGDFTGWTAVSVGGSSGSVTVNGTTPILGSYDAKFTIGDRTSVSIESDPGEIDLKAGESYGIIFKAVHDGAGQDQGLYVTFKYVGNDADVNVTYTEINSDDIQVGANNHRWRPMLENTEEWEEIVFTVPDDLASGDWYLEILADATSENNVWIDEIYIWEIGPTPADGSIPNPDTLIIAGHNMAGGFASPSDIIAQRCQADLSSFGGDEVSALLDLDADVTVAGNGVVFETFTASTSISPIIKVNFAAVSGKVWSVSELWLGKRWTWEKYPNSPLTAKQRTINSISSTARGGPTQSDKIFQQKVVSSTQELVDASEITEWVNFVEYAGHGKPFFLRIQAASALGVTASTEFMRCKSVPNIQEEPPVFYTVSFSFEEAF